MPRISMDGPENELAMVVIRNEITYIFIGLTSFFAIKTLSCHLRFMERCLEAGGLFHLGWSWRTGQSGSRARFFDSGDITVASTEHGREPQRTGATALAKRGWCRISAVMGSE